MRNVGVDEVYDAVLALVAEAARPVVLFDGGSGAGKTSLAARLAEVWAGRRTDPLQVVSLDDVYPGWHGLAAASAAVPGIVSGPEPGYRRWNWQASHPAEWVSLDPRRPILVEGCGALTRTTSPMATCRVWLDADEEVRKRRALDRDQGGFDPYWDVWAAQEQAHWTTNRPWELADLTVRTS